MPLFTSGTAEASAAWRYGFAVVVVALAAMLSAAMPTVLMGTPYLVFYPAVVAAAAFGGMGPGLVATGVSAFFLQGLFAGTQLPGHLLDGVQLARISLFVLGGAGISLVAGRRRAARAAAHRSEQLRRENEARFRIVAENANAVFGIVQGHRFVYANPFLSATSGYTNEEILAMDFLELVHPDHRAMIADYARRRQQGESVPMHYEFMMVTKTGEMRWMDFSPALAEYNGKPAIVGTAYDVTERKRAEDELRHSEERLRWSEERYRSLFNSIDEGFCIVEMIFDPSGRAIDYRFLTTNPAFAKQTGLVDAVGQTMRTLAPHHEESWFEIYGRVAQTGVATRFENQAAQLGRWYDVYAFRYGKPENRQVAILFMDITDRKKADEQLLAAKHSAERAKAAAEEASRAKDHFLAVLSHELRNPLTPVLATAALLHEDQSLTPDLRQQLEVIRRNAELEARLIDDLLDVTRITRGKLELAPERTELCTAIQRAIEVCRPDLDARGIHFGVTWGDRPYWIDADPARLQQVFWNLLKNAIKFTAFGGCIGMTCRRLDGQVVIEVTDTGVGIEPEMLGAVFSAFEQAVNRQFGGLGLGLAISKSLVELHGGTIEAHSEGKGRGAMFRVRLPLQVAPGGGPAPTAAPAVARQALRSLRILLVEDHGDTARIIQRLLRADGHEITLAGDVARALNALSADDFDLLISDLGLPDGSGLDLLKSARRSGFTRPAIALSGYGQDQDIQRTRDAGFVAHLIKPASPSRLREAIDRVARKS